VEYLAEGKRNEDQRLAMRFTWPQKDFNLRYCSYPVPFREILITCSQNHLSYSFSSRARKAIVFVLVLIHGNHAVGNRYLLAEKDT